MFNFIEYTKNIFRMIKGKKEIRMINEKIVRLHFVSGKTMDISFSNKKIDDLLEALKNNWKELYSIGPTWGINFSLITHYEIMDVLREA